MLHHRIALIILFLLSFVNIAFSIGMRPTHQDGGTLFTNTTYSYNFTMTNNYPYDVNVTFEVTSNSSSLSSYVAFKPSTATLQNTNGTISFNVTVNVSDMSSGNYTLVFRPRVTIEKNVTLSSSGVETGGAIVIVSAGTLGFEVQAAATTTTTTVPGAPGAGGGGGSVTRISNFTILNETVKVSLVQGEMETVYVIVENKGKNDLKLSVDVEILNKIVFPQEDEFTLKSGETKKLLLDVIARKDLEPDLYAGKLTIKGDDVKRTIPFYVEVETRKALFDVKIELPERYKKVLPNEDVYFAVSLYNLGKVGIVDVNIEYVVKDFENRVVTSDRETLAVETNVSYLKKIHIPLSVTPGKHVLYVKVTYDDSVAIASETFEVTEFLFPTIHPTILLVVITGIVLVFTFIRRESRKLVRKRLRRMERGRKKVRLRKRRHRH